MGFSSFVVRLLGGDKMLEKLDMLFVGVGGQGILTASDIVAEVGLAVGYDAKKSEVHGFSQRGGVVDSHVRWGRRVGASTAEIGQIDILLAFEMLEAARWLDWLRPGGAVIVNRQQIIPMSVSIGDWKYPPEEDILAAVRARTGQVVVVDGLAIGERLGKAQLANSVLLGALSRQIDHIDPDVWTTVIQRRVPKKYAELNRTAFWEGRM
jgi:indolepyruvate ferredoxin oxidoreductase beta subunit